MFCDEAAAGASLYLRALTDINGGLEKAARGSAVLKQIAAVRGGPPLDPFTAGIPGLSQTIADKATRRTGSSSGQDPIFGLPLRPFKPLFPPLLGPKKTPAPLERFQLLGFEIDRLERERQVRQFGGTTIVGSDIHGPGLVSQVAGVPKLAIPSTGLSLAAGSAWQRRPL